MAWLGLPRSASTFRMRVVAPRMSSAPLTSRMLMRPVAPHPQLALVSSPVSIQIRSLARLSRGRTRVDVEERTETGTTGLTEQTEVHKKEEYYREYDRDESQESALTPDVRRHLTKVYGTLMAGMGFAAAGSVAGTLAPGLAAAGFIGSFVAIIGLIFVDRSRVTFRQNLFLAITAMMGMSLGPMLAASAPGVIFAAGLGTSAIFGGFTLAALRAKRRSMLMLGGPLMGGLLLLVGISLSSMVLPLFGVTSPAILGALHNINLYGGLALFSLFISYDTQAMIESYKMGNDDHVSPALDMFLNVFNIFVRLLQIFRGD